MYMYIYLINPHIYLHKSEKKGGKHKQNCLHMTTVQAWLAGDIRKENVLTFSF